MMTDFSFFGELCF